MFAKAWLWRCARWLTTTLLSGICLMALAAEPSTLVRGSVLDAQGKPLAGVSVGLFLSKPVVALRKAQPKLTLATRTDAAGRFQLSLPQSLKQVTVVAHRSGLALGKDWVTLDAQQRELAPLRLSAGLTLNGRVSDEAGRVLAAAKISGDPWPLDDSTVGPLQRFSAQTRADGSFVITGLEPRPYRVRAELAGYGIWDKQHVYIDKKDPKSRTLEITLRPAAYLSGVITDPAGRPLPGAKVAELAEDPRIVALADAAGRFRLGPFEADREAQVLVSLSGHTSQRLMFKAPQSDLQLVLSQSGVLRGRVVDAATRTALNEFRIGIFPHDDRSIAQDHRQERRQLGNLDR